MAFKKGNIPWNTGKHTVPWNKGLKTGKPAWNSGKKLSEEHRRKVIKTLSSYGNQSGSKNLAWKGGRIITKEGYVKVKNYIHPHRTKNDYYPEHRLVMEASIGRILLRKEKVHHINGNKQDNRIENLVILSNKAHSRLHRFKEVNEDTWHSRRRFKKRKL